MPPIKLLPADVAKVKIPKSDYGTLPPALQTIIASYDYIWSVVITPKKDPTTTATTRVVVSAATNTRTGNLVVQNNGRTPAAPPPAGQDDLRPCSYYVMGIGSQNFRVYVPTATAIYIDNVVSFE